VPATPTPRLGVEAVALGEGAKSIRPRPRSEKPAPTSATMAKVRPRLRASAPSWVQTSPSQWLWAVFLALRAAWPPTSTASRPSEIIEPPAVRKPLDWGLPGLLVGWGVGRAKGRAGGLVLAGEPVLVGGLVPAGGLVLAGSSEPAHWRPSQRMPAGHEGSARRLWPRGTISIRSRAPQPSGGSASLRLAWSQAATEPPLLRFSRLLLPLAPPPRPATEAPPEASAAPPAYSEKAPTDTADRKWVARSQPSPLSSRPSMSLFSAT